VANIQKLIGTMI